MKYYYINMVPGITLKDSSMQDIPYPRVELASHITMKVSQAGAWFGTAIGPMVAMVRGNRSTDHLERAAFVGGRYGIISGLIVGPLLSVKFMSSRTQDSIIDRCYRLRYNKKQVRVDTMSLLGVAAGMGIYHREGKPLDVGAVLGYGAGCLAATILNCFL